MHNAYLEYQREPDEKETDTRDAAGEHVAEMLPLSCAGQQVFPRGTMFHTSENSGN